MKIDAVIFDMDGLMIDTEKLLHRYWIQAANENGYPMTMEHVLQIRSLAAKFAIPKLKSMLGEDFDYPKVRKRRMELMADHVEKYGIEKKKGLDELLDYLKERKYHLAVATATDMERTRTYLTKIGKLDYFDKIVCGSMVENGKPQPDIYLAAAARLGIPPEKCMALEDSPNGILAAYRAGCIPVMVPDLDLPDEETRKLLFAQVTELSEVCNLLEKVTVRLKD